MFYRITMTEIKTNSKNIVDEHVIVNLIGLLYRQKYDQPGVRSYSEDLKKTIFHISLTCLHYPSI